MGAAEQLGDRIRLTPSEPQTAGAVWLRTKKRIVDGFEARFQFQLTQQGGLGDGADGFAFVLQDEGENALAGRGSAGGFALGDGRQDRRAQGIAHSLAVFFDTFYNQDGQDPSDNYVAVCTNGAIRKMRWPPARLGVARKLPFRLKDGKVHSVRIRYAPPLLTVALDDGEPILRVPIDVSTVTDKNGEAYTGFTASTGSGFQNHDILGWWLQPEVSSDISVVSSNIHFLDVDCMEGKNLCTPGKASVEERSPGEFHIVLPAHLEWPASIPNPSGRTVAIRNVQGNVCFDLEASGNSGCSGPDGVPGTERKGLLVSEQNPGALVTKHERGRTWFSVNDRARQFADNQGFYEFNVRVVSVE